MTEITVSPSPDTEDILFAVQYIYTASKALYGSELLFRSQDSEIVCQSISGQRATSEVLINFISGLRDDPKTPDKPLFLNVDTDFLDGPAGSPDGPQEIVLALAAAQTDPLVLKESMPRWRNAGYNFALDNYGFEQHWEPLLNTFDYVSVDIAEQDICGVIDAFGNIDSRMEDTRWIATRIESEVVFGTCIDIGFDLFQGYFLTAPELVKGRKISSEQALVISIMKAVNDPEADIKRIADLVSCEPLLSFQLLKIVNSPLYHRQTAVSSLQQALVILGLDNLKYWATLIIVTAATVCAQESYRLIMIRARTTELLATCRHHDSRNGFLAGLLSGMDLLLNTDKAYVLSQINVAPEISEAVLKGEGELGETLTAVTAFEYRLMQEFDAIEDAGDVASCYGKACLWANDLMVVLKNHR